MFIIISLRTEKGVKARRVNEKSENHVSAYPDALLHCKKPIKLLNSNDETIAYLDIIIAIGARKKTTHPVIQ